MHSYTSLLNKILANYLILNTGFFREKEVQKSENLAKYLVTTQLVQSAEYIKKEK